MLRFYFNGSPNPTKVALFLEEAGLAFEAIPVDVRGGQQFDPAFLAINPNAKVPAIVDEGQAIFDSNAILLYLAEKTGKFLAPADARGQMLSWLMFVASGLGPFMGQYVHFNIYSPEKIPYARNRYLYEARRHLKVLDDHLATRRFMVAETYTIVDMAVWGWARAMPMVLGEQAAEFPNVNRLTAEIAERPAAIRAVALKDRHNFKTEMDREAVLAMFGHLREPA